MMEPVKVTAYNHAPVDGIHGTKPVIPNGLFKQALEKAQAGFVEEARKAVEPWSLDVTQKNLLSDYIKP
jgi:hypothetical protein